MDRDFSKTRINAAMMSSYQGRDVCLLGTVKNVDNDGAGFTLTTSDGADIRVIMQEPLNGALSGLVEVQGQVDARNNIVCQTFKQFSDEANDTFDMDMYNKAVELTAQYSQQYIVGIQQS